MPKLEKKQLRKLRSLVANEQGHEAGLAAKQAAAKACKSAHKKFARLAAMNTAIDAGGSDAAGVAKAKRKLADSWTKRTSHISRGFYNEKEARK